MSRLSKKSAPDLSFHEETVLEGREDGSSFSTSFTESTAAEGTISFTKLKKCGTDGSHNSSQESLTHPLENSTKEAALRNHGNLRSVSSEPVLKMAPTERVPSESNLHVRGSPGPLPGTPPRELQPSASQQSRESTPDGPGPSFTSRSSAQGHSRSGSRSSDPDINSRPANTRAVSLDFDKMKVSLILKDDDYEIDDLSITGNHGTRSQSSEVPNYSEKRSTPPNSLHNTTEVHQEHDWSRASNNGKDYDFVGVSFREGRRTPTNGQLSDSSGRLSFESMSPTGGSLNRSLTGKAGSDKKKKPYWYNVLSPTYKSRSEDFKRLFKDIPADERLIVDYSCALQKDILVHGRIYITQNWICFYANIFRWETVLTLRCKDIASMTKEKTARVIPNAIQISTKDDKYFFTSFGTRDKTYLMLFRVWQNALSENPMTIQELWQWVHYSYGEELGLTSSDEDYIQPSIDEEQSFNCRMQHEEKMAAVMEGVGVLDSKEDDDDIEPVLNGELSHASDALGTSGVADTRNIEAGKQDGTDNVQRSPQRALAVSADVTSAIPTDMSDNTEEEEGEVLCTGHEHFSIAVVDEVYNFTVDQLFEMIFTDSGLYRHFTEVKKTTELVQTQWSEDMDDQGDRNRTISYTLSLNYSIGPKTSPANEKQILRACSKPESFYLVDTECINSSIPYGDNFYVVNRYCLSRVSSSRCRLKISSAIRYRKSVWGLVKNFIEKNVTNGITDSFNCMADLLRQESTRLGVLQQSVSPPSGKKKVLRRRRNVSDRVPSTKRGPTEASMVPNALAQGTLPIKNYVSSKSQKGVGSNKVKDDWHQRMTADVLVRIICAVLIILAVFNALLFYKLWSLEQKATHLTYGGGKHEDTWTNTHDKPQSHSDWLDLLEQQQMSHDSEIERWKEILASSVKVMDSMKETLVSLEQSIQKRYPAPSPHKDSSHVHDEH